MKVPPRALSAAYMAPASTKAQELAGRQVGIFQFQVGLACSTGLTVYLYTIEVSFRYLIRRHVRSMGHNIGND